MRVIYLWLLSVFLLCFSGVSSASTLSTWQQKWIESGNSTRLRGFATWEAACAIKGGGYQTSSTTATCAGGFYVDIYTETCPYGDNSDQGLTSGIKCNTSCDAPSSMVDGQCVAPSDPCFGRQGDPTPYFEQFPSYGDYQANCKVSVDGCQVDVCSGAAAECGTKATGEFACWGSGTFTGESSTGTENPTSPPDPETPPPPTTTDSSSGCTPPQVNGSTTTYTCVSESDSSQFADSNCAYGNVNGVEGMHCTKPDYVPESDTKTTTDNVTETSNPDGSTTTTKETTTDRTTCKAGECTTTSTTTTTTTSRDSSGATTGETSTCQGDKCDDPSTPQDESEEEEEVERSATVGECEVPVSCDGDAIDCAILQEQNALKCEVIKQGDFDAHKTDIESMFQGEQFELETSDIQAPSFINSGTRFLPASCPPPETITLTSNGGHTFAFEYEPLCSFASDFSFLIVTMMGIWCAVYVGRAFGGE